MGAPRTTHIAAQNRAGLSAPRSADALWRRVHREDAWLRQGRRCCYCHDPLRRTQVTAEHVDPRRAGGPTSAGNIAAACAPCNSAKGHMSEKAFMKAVRRPTDEHRLGIRLAHVRRRICLRAEAAERRILRSVGLEMAA